MDLSVLKHSNQRNTLALKKLYFLCLRQFVGWKKTIFL